MRDAGRTRARSYIHEQKATHEAETLTVANFAIDDAVRLHAIEKGLLPCPHSLYK